MQVRRLIYISFYDYPGNTDDLISFPAANAKILYILSLLERLNYCVSMISLCTPRKGFFWLGRSKTVSDSVRLFYFPSFAQGGRVVNALSLYLKKFFLFFYLVFFTRRDDLVLVYHSLAYSDVVFFARKIKHFELILQVEEIYQDVVPCGKYISYFENAVFKMADKFLFPTLLLNQKVNFRDHPFIVVHGSYSPYFAKRTAADDGRTHVVYAGTFDVRKGVESAIRSALFLDERFCLHILGFGNQVEIRKVKSLIVDVQMRTKAIVSYDGLLSGEDYSEFISKCDFGLSPQLLDSKFNDTSFPSKILSYMCHGLKVITVRIPSIELSAVSAHVIFTRGSDPRDIADGVLEGMSRNNVDPRVTIDALDSLALSDFSRILQSSTRA